MSVVHLSEWLEARASGSTTENDVHVMSAHITVCAVCRALLTSDEEIRRRLALLRSGEPRVDVLDRVMRHIEEIDHD